MTTNLTIITNIITTTMVDAMAVTAGTQGVCKTVFDYGLR